MIGIIGGYGDVGLEAVKSLAQWGKSPLRIGGRNPAEARKRLGGALPQAEWRELDLEDARSLAAFAADCELVLNCAGPSHRASARVARLCASLGCHYVDAGDDPMFREMRAEATDRVILYAAGASPGLSGLLPRWLAGTFDDTVHSLWYCMGSLDRFTASAAEDYLAGIAGGANEPLAAWRDGARRPSAAQRRSGVALPGWSRDIALYPYMDEEAEEVASTLSLRDGEWHIAVDGTATTRVLEEARAQFATEPGTAVRRLCEATALDSAGRSPYMHLIVQLAGRAGGTECTRTLLVQADRPAAMTGRTAAAAARAVLEGEIPAGVRPLAGIPDPEPVARRLREDRSTRWTVINRSVAEMMETEEGEI